mgnify:CR=1 FL=1
MIFRLAVSYNIHIKMYRPCSDEIGAAAVCASSQRSEQGFHMLTSLLASHGVRQTGPSAIYVSIYYISRTRSWVKPTIWVKSPPISPTIHTGAQLHGEPRGVC